MADPAEKALAIGASAGGIIAVQRLLPSLQGARLTAIIVVLHLHRHNPVPLTKVFSGASQLPLREAEEKCILQAGVVYFAPANYHLLVERDRTFSLNADAPVQWARPSIDVLFQSLARAYRHSATALLLTGANRDGAEGCHSLCLAGATVVVQDPEEAEVDSMPRAALSRCGPLAQVLSLSQMSSWLSQQVEEGHL